MLGQETGRRSDAIALSDDQLAGELRRRGYAVTKLGRDLLLPGLLVFGDRRAVVWKGEEVRLTRREHQIVSALAQVYPRALTPRNLRFLVWGGTYDDSNAHCYVCYLNKKLPGLIGGRGGKPRNAAYHLLLDTPA